MQPLKLLNWLSGWKYKTVELEAHLLLHPTVKTLSAVAAIRDWFTPVAVANVLLAVKFAVKGAREPQLV